MTTATRQPQPLILIRGFGGFDTDKERSVAYQGFNDGTVYPHKRGENYIYEGMILRLIKSFWQYQDATNVVGYYAQPINAPAVIPEELKHLDPGFFSGEKVVIDPAMALYLMRTAKDLRRTFWVFRYYDLADRNFATYGKALARLIDFIRALAVDKNGVQPKVNIVAHSMGGLLARELVQSTYPNAQRQAEDYVNKIVTLGTPHRGVSFQIIRNWIATEAEEEFERFNPRFQEDPNNPASYKHFGEHFPLERLLTVVGTNYRNYRIAPATMLNRFFSVSGEYGPNYNRSDGLVKQTSAQIPGAPRTFVHKPHGGPDSLITARESFEIATRFFFGNVRVRLRLLRGKITRGYDFFGKSEFFLGMSIKPRRVDFELFHQSGEAENCYGPFREDDLSDEDLSFPWADDNKLVWEGYLDTTPILEDASITKKDLVMRLDFYVGERDLFGIGFSDNVVFRKQYYVRALLDTRPLELYLHTGEEFAREDFDPSRPSPDFSQMVKTPQGWEFEVKGTGFAGTFRLEIDRIPETGEPVPFTDK
jgi:pimeloyl-ACP methyl ester carboxylesterase